MVQRDSIDRKFIRAFKDPRLAASYLKLKLKIYSSVLLGIDSRDQAYIDWLCDEAEKTLRFNYPLNSRSIVLDLGGYEGDFAFEINKKFDCTVYVYEPIRQYYEFCLERFKDNQKITVLPYGISDKSSSTSIYKAEESSSVVFQISKDEEKISLVKFEEEFNRLDIDVIDLLKMNVEGSEFLIVPHLIKTGLIKNVHNLQVQFHSFYPNAKKLRKNLREKLAVTHTEDWNYPFVWESWKLK